MILFDVYIDYNPFVLNFNRNIDLKNLMLSKILELIKISISRGISSATMFFPNDEFLSVKD